MHKNQIWLAFLSSLAMIVFGFTAYVSYKLYHYYSLNTQTAPVEVQWSVEAKAHDRYFLSASYRYIANGHSYQETTLFEDTTFKNIKAASEAIARGPHEPLIVWYSKKSPQDSSLGKTYPAKDCFYTVVLWGLLLYFIWLGFYVGKFKSYVVIKD